MITLVQNGHTIIDNKEISGITGGALDSHEESSEKGHVLYSKIVLTPAEKSSNWHYVEALRGCGMMQFLRGARCQ